MTAPWEPYQAPHSTAMPDPPEELITILMAITRDPSLPRHRAGCGPCWWADRITSGGW